MKNILLTVTILFTFSGFSQNKKIEKKAEAFIVGLQKQQYSKIYKQFNDTMKLLMPVLDFKSSMTRFKNSQGDIKSIEFLKTVEGDKMRTVLNLLSFEEGKPLIMTLSFNKDNEIAGMYFRPAASKSNYSEPTKYGLSGFRERKLSLPTPVGDLAAVLTLPKEKLLSPVVIMVHGSGPNDMDGTVKNNKVFYDLSLGLIDSGIATFRYNKRTLTYGGSFSDTATLYSEVIEDVLAAISLLKTQNGIDTNKIYVLGHSLGAMSAPLIAKYNSSLAGIVMMGAPCRGLWESLPMQYQYLKENTNQAITEQTVLEAKQFSTNIGKGYFSHETPKDSLFGLSASYWQYLRDYNASSTLKELSINAYVLQGERDYQVNMDDYNCFKEKIGAKATIKFEVIPGSNHLFIFGKGKSVPAEYEIAGNVDLVVIKKIANWINK